MRAETLKLIKDFMAASTDLATLGSSVGCFVAGTTVKTEEGDKAIEEIEAGDKVLSYEVKVVSLFVL